MSCIGQILKKKDSDGLIKIHDEDGILRVIGEGGGEYRLYEYFITFNDMGFRCGYVAVPPSHTMLTDPNTTIDESVFDVPGGITFSSTRHEAKSAFGIQCDDLWLGFDCSHYGDNMDKKAALKYFSHRPEIVYLHKTPSLSRYSGIIRDYAYVEEQCKHLIEQLIEYDKQQ